MSTPTRAKPAKIGPQPVQTGPKPAQNRPKPAQTSPKPAQTGPNPAKTGPKPAQNQNLRLRADILREAWPYQDCSSSQYPVLGRASCSRPAGQGPKLPPKLVPKLPGMCRDDSSQGAGWGTTRAPFRCPGRTAPKLFQNWWIVIVDPTLWGVVSEAKCLLGLSTNLASKLDFRLGRTTSAQFTTLHGKYLTDWGP